jgi:hypothetical protein
MLSRIFAVVISSWLPALGVVLPVSALYEANALVVGILATVLSGFALVDERARKGAALLGAWAAFMPLFVDGSLVEKCLNITWGVAVFTFLIGPFSESPASSWVRPARVPVHAPVPQAELRAAA